MKQFNIDYNTLHNHSDNPTIFIPFTDSVLEEGSELVFAVNTSEGCETFSEDSSFEEHMEAIYEERDSRYIKDIEEFDEEREDYFYDEDEFHSYIRFMGKEEDYLSDYINGFSGDYVSISIVYGGFGCGGGPVGDETILTVIDKGGKIAALTQEEFTNEIIKNLDKEA